MNEPVVVINHVSMVFNIASEQLNSLKEYFNDSIFMIGKNHVMQVGLGKNEEEESKEGSSKLNKYLKGNCGLFFTDKEPDDIISYFKEYSSPYFGNVGSISNQTLILKRGFDEHLADFPSSMESQFRQLGMNIKVDDEKQALIPEETACIHCGRCHKACPFKLLPTEFADAYKHKDVERLQMLAIDQCMTCGSCSFICPAHRPLSLINTLAKGLVKEAGSK